MTDEPRSRPKSLALVGVGFSFAAIVGIMSWLGHLADGKFGTTPWLLIAGAMVGVAVATWDLIRTVNALEKHRGGKDE